MPSGVNHIYRPQNPFLKKTKLRLPKDHSRNREFQSFKNNRPSQKNLSIPDSLKLPSLNLLFEYISGEESASNNGEFLKIDSKLLDHVYFVKRQKYPDGIIFLINDKDKQSLEPDEITADINPMLNKIFKHYPDLGKIITIPLKVDSLTDVLKILNEKPKTPTERDNRIGLLKSKLEIGSSQTFYPEHKKNYSNHVEFVLNKFFEKFQKIERVSRPDFDLFVYNFNENQNLIVDFQDRSQSLTGTNNRSASKEQHIAALKGRYSDAPVLKITTDGKKEGLGEEFQIEHYEKLAPTKLSIAASTGTNLYDLQLEGTPKNLAEITDSNSYFKPLKTAFESRLPENTGARGEKIIEALFQHWGAETELMSSKPGHRYDLKIKANEEQLNSPLALLQNSHPEILVEIKTSKDDYPSIRSLTVNQVQLFQNLNSFQNLDREQKQTAIIAKVVLNSNAGDSDIETKDIFTDYPPKLIENENGFAVLKPDLENSKDAHSPYSKIYLFTFDELKGSDESGKLKAPATISQLELSVNLNEVNNKIAKSKGKEIDLRNLSPNMTDLERGIYFNNLKKLREVEQKLRKANSFKNSANVGFAKTFADRSNLRKQRQDIMKNLLIIQLTKNNPMPNLELIEYYSSSPGSSAKRSSITTGNPDINENIFVFKDKRTGEIKPYEIMFFSPADPVQQYTQDHLSNRNIFDDLELPVRVAFYDNSKIYLFKEELPKKALKKLAEFKDLNNVKKGVLNIEDSIFKSIEPIGVHLRPGAMLKHSFA
jgi:hypothetical protein